MQSISLSSLFFRFFFQFITLESKYFGTGGFSLTFSCFIANMVELAVGVRFGMMAYLPRRFVLIFQFGTNFQAMGAL